MNPDRGMKTVVDNLERGWAGELVPATPSSLPWAGENGGENMLSSSLQQPSSGKPPVPPGQPRMPGIGKLHAPPTPHQGKHVEEKDLQVGLRAVRGGRCGKGN